MDFDALIAAYSDRLEDFWGRRTNRPRFVRQADIFDRSIHFSSNDEGVLKAVDYSQPLYSTALRTDKMPFAVQLVVHASPVDPGPAPENLVAYIQYAGDADWLMIRLGKWGQCYIDLTAGRAIAVLTAPLAERPDLVSRCLLNTVLTNFFIARGYGMLHASCLVQGNDALLLMAPHNTGKSTTALRLALAGYRLVSDSMIFLSDRANKLVLFGFPVGKVKLRQDMVQQFPQLRPLLAPEPVRDEIKYNLDLRDIDSGLVHEAALTPSAVHLCLLTRSTDSATTLTRARRAEVVKAVMANSLFFDTPDIWRRNMAQIGRLLDQADLYRLAVGSEGEEIVEVVTRLWKANAK